MGARRRQVARGPRPRAQLSMQNTHWASVALVRPGFHSGLLGRFQFPSRECRAESRHVRPQTFWQVCDIEAKRSKHTRSHRKQ